MLHFTGTIQPLRETPLTCPINAFVERMNYHYGQYVPQNEIIFTLNSAELQRQYNETLTEYLKAKDAYNIAQTKFAGTEELWQAGLLSKNNYLNEKSGLNTTRIGLMQASRKLAEMLEKLGAKEEDLTNLSFAEFDKVRTALNDKHNLIHIRAPYSGLLLYPPKMGGERNQHISAGSTLKTGQLLGLIGDLHGIRVEIDIPEVDISDIRIGMPATIHGIAFGKYTLHGQLVAINAQASAGNNNSLPSFSAVIEVKSLTPDEQGLIKVGMSATIELAVANAPQIVVPIAAIKQKEGQSVVQVRDKNGHISTRIVTTGAVIANQVAIETGLNVGEVIIYG